MLPLETEYFIPKDAKVRLLDQVLEELNYKGLYLTYSDKGRNSAVEPVTLFKIMVLAYSDGIWTSRKIEEACRYDIRYRYLLQGQPVPDHNTVNRFRKKHLGAGVLNELLTQLNRKLIELGEIRFTEVFIDGTKIEANANRYSFVWRKTTEKNYGKLKEKASRYLKGSTGEDVPAEQITAAVLKQAFRKIRNRAEKEHAVFRYGKGNHKTELQRQYETLKEYLERSEQYEEALKTLGDGRNSYSKTDPDATFMHMKEDHMRNGQLKPGYNVQAATNSEYILGIFLSEDRTDQKTLIPFLEQLKKTYGRTFGRVAADAGYESEENYAYLEKEGIRPFIKPSDHEYSKTKAYAKAMEWRNAMTYDKESDSYTCKGGRTLSRSGTKKQTNPKTGYISESKTYVCADCSGCPYLGKCYRGKYAKEIRVAEKFHAYRAESERNICSEEGVLLRINRSIQAEGVFGITKQDMGFTRFLTRGKENVKTEYLLLAFGFNINKLHYRIQGDRLGKSLLLPENIKESA